MNEHIVIISGASPIPDPVLARIPDEAIVLAADGGLDHALAAGLRPSGVIGDMDSITAGALAWAEEHATISRHPDDKDETDTELALAFAAAMNPARVTLIGGGDRLDHSITSVGALGARRLTSIPELEAWWDGEHVRVLHGPGRAVLELVAGSNVSLMAMHGRCSGVSIRNVRWELDGVDLDPLVGWGVSNVVGPATGDGTSTSVEIALSTGVLTVFDVPATADGGAR